MLGEIDQNYLVSLRGYKGGCSLTAALGFIYRVFYYYFLFIPRPLLERRVFFWGSPDVCSLAPVASGSLLSTFYKIH